MPKRFVRIKQMFYVDAIMDIGPDETEESIKERVFRHLENNGGANTVINQGGDISLRIGIMRPTKADEDAFECID